MLELYRKAKEYIDTLSRPSGWFHRAHSKPLFLFWGFVVLGVFLNRKWHFPHFPVFCICFLFIGSIAVWSVSFFAQKMEHITASVANQPAARRANFFYFKYCVNSSLYIWGPLTIIFIFGMGCWSMFGAIRLTPTLIWMVVLFFIVVYISIIGYLQYIVLAIYIYNLAHSSENYRNLPKSAVECIPAQLEWIQALTKLSHIYRSAFFSLGSAYIIGYCAFCWLPEMQANTSLPAFYLLWGIIFIVIVMLFPIVSVLEYHWIKMIIEQLKVCYIMDLVKENNIKEKSETMRLSPAVQRLVQTLCATQILNSKDYPLESVWEIGYAALLSVFNFAAAVTTIIQCLPLQSSAFLHIL